MLGTSWECHKVREFALRPMGDFYWCWIYNNFRSPFLRMLHMKFGFDWPSGFRLEDL